MILAVARELQRTIVSADTDFGDSWPGPTRAPRRSCCSADRTGAGPERSLRSSSQTSEAVLWEIGETLRQNSYIFGIQIHREKTHRVPNGLLEGQVIRWDFDQTVKWLAAWT